MNKKIAQTIRLPQEMWDALDRLAAENGRSRNGEVEWVLRAAVGLSRAAGRPVPATPESLERVKKEWFGALDSVVPESEPPCDPQDLRVDMTEGRPPKIEAFHGGLHAEKICPTHKTALSLCKPGCRK